MKPAANSPMLLCFPTSSSTPSLAGTASMLNGGESKMSLLDYSGHRGKKSRLWSMVFYIILLIANVSLLCCGALYLSWLERPSELAIRQRINEQRLKFASDILDDDPWKLAQLDKLLGITQEAAQKGIITTLPNGKTNEKVSVWSFGSTMLFLTTIATTVGYGHAAPQSASGKIFSMLYGTLAIPLLLAFFSETIRKLVGGINVLFKLVSKFCWNYDDVTGSSTRNVAVKVGFVISASIVLISATVFIPAVVFVHLEPHWSFLDGLYYCFISMTTVGLGDIIPGEDVRWGLDGSAKEVYMIGITLYLLTSLPLFFLAIKLISSLLSIVGMSIKLPFCGEGNPVDVDNDHGFGTCRSNRKPDSREARRQKMLMDSDEETEAFSTTSGFVPHPYRGRIDEVITSDEELTQSAADDDDVKHSNLDKIKQTVVQTKSTDSADTAASGAAGASAGRGSFSFMFPQPTFGVAPKESKKKGTSLFSTKK